MYKRQGYYYILGRTDDVINVAGHRLGTKEIEEAIGHHPEVAESAVVGIHDELKGELPIAFCILKNHDLVAETENRFRIEQQIVGEVARQLGALAKPAAIYFPNANPAENEKSLAPPYVLSTGGRQRNRRHEYAG